MASPTGEGLPKVTSSVTDGTRMPSPEKPMAPKREVNGPRVGTAAAVSTGTKIKVRDRQSNLFETLKVLFKRQQESLLGPE